jgi:hypothetical protein
MTWRTISARPCREFHRAPRKSSPRGMAPWRRGIPPATPRPAGPAPPCPRAWHILPAASTNALLESPSLGEMSFYDVASARIRGRAAQWWPRAPRGQSADPEPQAGTRPPLQQQQEFLLLSLCVGEADRSRILGLYLADASSDVVSTIHQSMPHPTAAGHTRCRRHRSTQPGPPFLDRCSGTRRRGALCGTYSGL